MNKNFSTAKAKQNISQEIKSQESRNLNKKRTIVLQTKTFKTQPDLIGQVKVTENKKINVQILQINIRIRQKA